MKTRDDFASDKAYAAWVHGRMFAFGIGWLEDYCASNDIPMTEEELEERLYEETPVGQFEQGFQVYWSITHGDVSIPCTLPDLIEGAKAGKGDQGAHISEVVQAFKAHVKSQAAAQLAKDAKADTPQKTQENAAFAIEEGVEDLVAHLCQNIGETPDDSDYFGVWVDTDHGGLWVWIDPEEVEAMCRTAYPDVFQLIDGAITSVGGGA